MGEAELIKPAHQIIIHSIFHFYGEAATKQLAIQIAEDIANHWNEPGARAKIKGDWFDVKFDIVGYCQQPIEPAEVWYNTNPRNNFFRIEEFSMNHVSSVDGLNSNTGYFKYDTRVHNSTTAAHE